MSAPKKHVVFDVVGTCVSYDAIFNALDSRLGDRLRAECIKPKLLGYTWFEAAEREYTYLSISGRYIRFYDVFRSLFYRMLWMAGIEEPRKFATDDDLAYILEQFMQLDARPGVAECFQILRDAGFTCWAFTAGDVQRVSGYFTRNGIDMPAENFMSCDSLGIGKPAPESYQPLLTQFAGEEAWFAAAHMWDVSAAKSTGFKGAYCTVWEKEPCIDLFGTMDVMADTFPEMARRIPSQQGRGPVPKPVPSFWNAEPRMLDDYRSTAELPSVSDIVIVGAGFAGVATAYHLLKDNPNPPSIVLLEARNLCSGATGRNGGHVKPDTYYNVPKYTKLYGTAAAAELAAFEASHVLAVKGLVESENLDCDFHLTRAVDVYLDPEHAKQTEASYRELVKAGVVDLRDVAFIPKDDAERVSGVKGAQCCFSFTAAHLWPSKMVHQLVEKLLAKGLSLHTNTPVSAVSPQVDSKGIWTIQTPRGAIRAPKVIYATNGYTAQVLPEYCNTIVPVRGICSHIESPKKQDTPHLVNTYGIRFDALNNDYLIPRADGSIVVGGARQRFWHNKDRWFDNVRDDEVVGEAVSYFDGYMQRHFRGWENSDAKAKEVWTGIMGYSSDFMPHIGDVPGKSGQFIIAGFSGHGMPEILLSSKGLATMVRDSVSFEESGLPRIFKTSESRISSKKSLLEESMQSLWNGSTKPKL
ncbi:FAD dependent oxidoreductase-domain-containing protein [Ilyonectria robusta]|uniref:FAD dependent oxidoreductase-domain-containing protein n=1 Tax=Ilyonectria robusta TaxID=1079257 RepID=UPI001E8E20E9|nr:FAD dependent oxidoreductase-domain-containing protein [Ilyonectria robusta]KAH8673246.1 FAD dependent oxidoreductase-domain-containing protein [Ilyonectria robusta]